MAISRVLGVVLAGVSGMALAAEPAPVVVDRGWFGWCPTGYVDHPGDPAKCVLPAALERRRRALDRMAAERAAEYADDLARMREDDEPTPQADPNAWFAQPAPVSPSPGERLLEDYEREQAQARAVEAGVTRALENYENRDD